MSNCHIENSVFLGVFVSKSDVGVSTIVGSAVFNILCIIGVCALFAGRETKLTWWPLFRDSSYYLLSVVTLIAVAYDERVEWWESVILVVLYLFYILLMVLNRDGQLCFELYPPYTKCCIYQVYLSTFCGVQTLTNLDTEISKVVISQDERSFSCKFCLI